VGTALSADWRRPSRSVGSIGEGWEGVKYHEFQVVLRFGLRSRPVKGEILRYA